jgi:hypothetical protein
MIAKRIGLICAGSHSLLFLITFLYVIRSTDGQAQLVWAPFVLVDFPISGVFYLLCFWWYIPWLHSVESSLLKQVLFPAYWLYGPIAAAYWYYLPRLLMPQRLGGVW